MDPFDKSTQIKFLTCDIFPWLTENFQVFFGASVSARSVKLIDKDLKTTDRDTWWQELRKEIEQNALCIGCTHILGYREMMHIYEDIMIMNVYGSALKVKARTQPTFNRKNEASSFIQSMHRTHTFVESSQQLKDLSPANLKLIGSNSQNPNSIAPRNKSNQNIKKLLKIQEQLRPCQFCHIIKSKNVKNQSYQQAKTKCLECDQDYVPEIIISTIDPPEGLNVIGPPQLLEERVSRQKRNNREFQRNSEKHAIYVSEQIFFIEYYLHSNLINQIKFMGKNSIFSLRIQIYVNDTAIIGVASCTALTLKALPIPPPIKIQVDEFFKGFSGQKAGEDLIRIVEKKSKDNVKCNFKMPVFRIIGLSSNQIKQILLNQQIQDLFNQEQIKRESIENKLSLKTYKNYVDLNSALNVGSKQSKALKESIRLENSGGSQHKRAASNGNEI